MIKEFINKVLHVPFVEGGRSYSGCDCWGLIVLAYEEVLGIEIPSYGDVAYRGKETLQSVGDEISNITNCQNEFVQVDTPEFGDILFFNMMGRPIHVGFVIDDQRMIHASKESGVSVENYRGMKWEKRLQAIYRHKKQ